MLANRAVFSQRAFEKNCLGEGGGRLQEKFLDLNLDLDLNL
jgi:hypothetical protein